MEQYKHHVKISWHVRQHQKQWNVRFHLLVCLPSSQFLPDRGAGIYFKNEDWPTALQEFAYSEHEAEAQLLLHRGADIGVKDSPSRLYLSPPVVAFHSRTIWSLSADEKDIGEKPSSCHPNLYLSSPVISSYSRHILSANADAIIRPSRERSTATVSLQCSSSFCHSSPVVVFHSHTGRYTDAERKDRDNMVLQYSSVCNFINLIVSTNSLEELRSNAQHGD